MVRAPGVCNFDPETTVLAHFRMDTGMGQKPLDLVGSWACSSCHDILDRRAPSAFTREQLDLLHLHGMVRTINALNKKGLLK
jgi:Protein of unknown function (DUF1364)